jgi:hypothetical protein
MDVMVVSVMFWWIEPPESRIGGNRQAVSDFCGDFFTGTGAFFDLSAFERFLSASAGDSFGPWIFPGLQDAG